MLVLLAFAMAGHPVVAQQNQPAPAGSEQAGTTEPDGTSEAASEEDSEDDSVMVVRTEEAQARIDALKEQLAKAVDLFNTDTMDDQSYAELSATVLDITQQAQAITQEFQPRVNSIENRLKELEPKGEGSSPSEAAKIEAESQHKILSELSGVMQQAQVVAIQATDLSLSITQQRQAKFSERIFKREMSLVDPAFWSDVVTVLPRLAWRTQHWLKRWQTEYRPSVDQSLAIGFFIVLLAVIYLIIRSRRYILKRVTRDPDIQPRRSQIVTSALSIALVNIVSASVAAALLYVFLEWTGSVPEKLKEIRIGVLIALTFYVSAIGLSRALFAPQRPNWQLVPVRAGVSLWLAPVLHFGAMLGTSGIIVGALIEALAIPDPIVSATKGLLAVTFAVVCFLGLRGIGMIDKTRESAATSGGGLWRLLLPVSWIAVMVMLMAPIFGFIQLGWFMAGWVMLSAMVIGLMYLLLNVIEQLSTNGFKPDQPMGRFVTTALGSSREGAEQIGILAGGLSKLVLILFSGVVIAFPWGLSTSDIDRMETMFTRFRIGTVTISLATIVGAIVIFVVGFTMTRAIQRWLEKKYLPKTRLDVGLKTSILTGLGYVGVVIAAMFAFSHLGLALENLALVAGALSVGIGFGLQSVVSNFVSGLILLAERPIRTGDWVVVNGEHGTVRKINVRSTEIETFDRATMIVPNSDLISGVVTNWVLNDNTGRIIITVGVDYASDPDQVREVLLDCARNNPLVLAYPAPMVFFMNFGASSLDFELRCYLSDIGMGLSARSDLRFEIVRRFREEGIEMPFPQRVVHLRQEGDAVPVEDAAPATRPTQPSPNRRDAESTDAHNDE